MKENSEIRNYLSIDVEEHFQVSAFENVISLESWTAQESRVQNNTLAILDLLDDAKTSATFFIVGWVAERNPELVIAIDRAGHEVACHSNHHRKVYDLTPKEFREDTRIAKKTIEKILGKRVRGYRAPSYSITKRSLWALPILEELGFEYDSSIFPVYHDNYGIPGSPRFEYTLDGLNLKEYPISTSNIFGLSLPVSGGGYFRLFPYWFTRSFLRRINRQDGMPFMFYLHPWEIDPGQPRIAAASTKSKFRHYVNISKTSEKFKRLLGDFKFKRIN